MKRSEYNEFEDTFAEFMRVEGLNCLGPVHDGFGYPVENEFSVSRCDCCGTTIGGKRTQADGYSTHNGGEIRHYEVCDNCLTYANEGQLDDMTMMDMVEDVPDECEQAGFDFELDHLHANQ